QLDGDLEGRVGPQGPEEFAEVEEIERHSVQIFFQGPPNYIAGRFSGPLLAASIAHSAPQCFEALVSITLYRPHHTHHLGHWPDIMDTDDRRPVCHGPGDGRRGPEQPGRRVG